jgi:tetratricopeptide (TPR) repeat protein
MVKDVAVGVAKLSRISGRATDARGDLLQRAQSAFHGGRAGEAEHLARELLAVHPDNSEALRLLGITLLAQGRPRDAIVPLEAAVRGRADPIAETDLARALQESGRTADALACLQRAVVRQPPFVPAFQRLAVLLCSLRRFDEAESVAKRGLEAAPADPESSVVLGGICLKRADAAGAKIAYARALANAPGHLRAMHGFGTALLYQGDFAGAAKRFQRVLAGSPAHPRAGLDLGHCLLELGRWDEAIACLRATVKAAPRQYGNALRILVAAGRGRFWIRPSQAAEFLMSGNL